MSEGSSKMFYILDFITVKAQIMCLKYCAVYYKIRYRKKWPKYDVVDLDVKQLKYTDPHGLELS